MRLESWTRIAWLAAAAITALAWLGYRQPDMEFALFGWIALCT
jgi:hypothetical protein